MIHSNVQVDQCGDSGQIDVRKPSFLFLIITSIFMLNFGCLEHMYRIHILLMLVKGVWSYLHRSFIIIICYICW